SPFRSVVTSPLFPYTTLFRSSLKGLPHIRANNSHSEGALKREAADQRALPRGHGLDVRHGALVGGRNEAEACCRNGGGCVPHLGDRKSTRLNSSHVSISYAVF